MRSIFDREKLAEEKKESSKRAVDIYKDWLKTRSSAQMKDTKKKLKETSKTGLKFGDVIREMGSDGEQILKIFNESWMSFGQDPLKAKKNFAKALHSHTPDKKPLKEATDAEKKGVKINAEEDGSVQKSIEMSYTPVTDRSNAMLSNVSATTRDLVIQIRHALVAGNMDIASQLIKTGWGSLSLKQRNGLIEFVNAMDPYNKLSEVPKSRNTLRIKPIEKRSDMTKDQFAEKLVRTAQEFLRVE